MCVCCDVCVCCVCSLQTHTGFVYDSVLAMKEFNVPKWCVCMCVCDRTVAQKRPWTDDMLLVSHVLWGRSQHSVPQFLTESHQGASGVEICSIVHHDSIKTHDDDSLSWFPLSLLCSPNAPTMLRIRVPRQVGRAAELQTARGRLQVMHLL